MLKFCSEIQFQSFSRVFSQITRKGEVWNAHRTQHFWETVRNVEKIYFVTDKLSSLGIAKFKQNNISKESLIIYTKLKNYE